MLIVQNDNMTPQHSTGKINITLAKIEFVDRVTVVRRQREVVEGRTVYKSSGKW